MGDDFMDMLSDANDPDEEGNVPDKGMADLLGSLMGGGGSGEAGGLGALLGGLMGGGAAQSAGSSDADAGGLGGLTGDCAHVAVGSGIGDLQSRRHDVRHRRHDDLRLGHAGIRRAPQRIWNRCRALSVGAGLHAGSPMGAPELGGGKCSSSGRSRACRHGDAAHESLSSAANYSCSVA